MEIIEAKLANGLPELAGVPEEIQWAPPGEHTINGFLNGKPSRFRVLVDEEAAASVAHDFAARRNDANAGLGDYPYLDFDHRGERAAGRVQGVRWAGEDPKQGGIRVAVEWTGSGKSALEAKDYRRFSPKFFITKEGKITGAPVNMGGLVNEAAFSTIQAVAKQSHPEDPSDLTETQKRKTMQDETALAEARAKILKLEAELAEAMDSAKNAKEALATAQAQLREQAKASAESKVQAAVAAGKIPPQAVDLQKRWADMIVADAKNAELLDNLPENPALKKVIGQAASSAGGPLDTPAHRQMAFVRQVQARAAGTTFERAWDIAREERPDLFPISAP